MEEHLSNDLDGKLFISPVGEVISDDGEVENLLLLVRKVEGKYTKKIWFFDRDKMIYELPEDKNILSVSGAIYAIGDKIYIVGREDLKEKNILRIKKFPTLEDVFGSPHENVMNLWTPPRNTIILINDRCEEPHDKTAHSRVLAYDGDIAFKISKDGKQAFIEEDGTNKFGWHNHIIIYFPQETAPPLEIIDIDGNKEILEMRTLDNECILKDVKKRRKM
ncbi:MAG: hypothetical protein J7K73_01205 [Nanoarchaeota archaeon]|nr:hypothetical protein [Nanoarchaeota archaeon]